MSISSWFRALLIRSAHVARQGAAINELAERLQRLEIRDLQRQEKQAYLEEAQERLLGRLNGRTGGRPAARASDQAQLDLSAIPKGDKVALRRALGVVK